MPRALVSLGSNLGDSAGALDHAIARLGGIAKAPSLYASRRLRTLPVGGPAGQGDFLNAAVTLDTTLTPQALLAELRSIEDSLERRRPERWAARTLDLDLLLYGEQTVHSATLRVPHPRMTFRPFVLEPAAEIAGGWRHPETGLSLAELLSRLRGGRDAVALVGKDPRALAWVRAAAAGLAVEIAEATPSRPPKLTIDTRPRPPVELCAGPRLALADCPPEHWQDEVVAALECVWPSDPPNALHDSQ